VIWSEPGYFGALGGVVIAVGLPWMMLLYGQDLAAWVRPTVIILALILGGLLAAASVVVGITIPSALKSDKLQIGGCCEKSSDSAGVPSGEA
jgi:hypothetical protein